MTLRERSCWGVMWRNKKPWADEDGEHRYLMMMDGAPVLFRTRKVAVLWIREKFGYIAKRPDLRAWPHGWRMPLPVRVSVSAKLSK